MTRPHPPTRRASAIALLVLLPAPTVGVLFALYLMPGTAIGQAVWSLSKLWLLAVPLAYLLLIERGRPSWSPPKHGGLLVGTLTGVVIFAAIIGAYYTFGYRWIDAEKVGALAKEAGIASPLILLAGAVYWSTVNAALEEYVWRWFVFRRFEDFTPTRVAILLAALAFTFHHLLVLANYFDWRITVLGSVGVGVGGLTWSWLYARYRSVWPAYISHAFADVAIMIVAYQLIFGV